MVWRDTLACKPLGLYFGKGQEGRRRQARSPLWTIQKRGRLGGEEAGSFPLHSPRRCSVKVSEEAGSFRAKEEAGSFSRQLVGGIEEAGSFSWDGR